jgi:hypothetical protein
MKIADSKDIEDEKEDEKVPYSWGGPTISRDKRLQNVAPRGTAFNC